MIQPSDSNSDSDPTGRPLQAERKSSRILETARRTDAMPSLVATARFVRRLLPGDEQYGDPLSTSGDELPQHLGRLVAERESPRPSAVRELGLGALQAWQALSEAQRRGRGTIDLAILFTDLAGFSDWALGAGDAAALELLRKVGAVQKDAISENGGTLVKWLGDGAMAVFDNPEQAVRSALEIQRRLAEVNVEDYTPKLRAGVHYGRPRKIGSDYLGVDVNIAARVGDAAKAGEVLVSETALATLEPSAFRFGRHHRLKASGAPRDLAVCSVASRN
ncbi:MAG: adenylate/guanylate cyclase domain-containing protein [Solirubrobacterales bacterium]